MKRGSMVVLVNKPFNMLSQFSPPSSASLSLRHINPPLPTDVYPLGRLDGDSEGILLLASSKHAACYNQVRISFSLTYILLSFSPPSLLLHTS